MIPPFHEYASNIAVFLEYRNRAKIEDEYQKTKQQNKLICNQKQRIHLHLNALYIKVFR